MFRRACGRGSVGAVCFFGVGLAEMINLGLRGAFERFDLLVRKFRFVFEFAHERFFSQQCVEQREGDLD